MIWAVALLAWNVLVWISWALVHDPKQPSRPGGVEITD